MATSASIPPLTASTTSYVVATAIVAGVTGFFIGQGAALGLFSSSSSKRSSKSTQKKSWPNSYDVKVHRGSSDEEDGEETGEEESDEEDEDEDEDEGGELANFEGNNEEVKLVLVVRTDLGMTKGMCIIFYFLFSVFALSGLGVWSCLSLNLSLIFYIY